MENSVRRLHCGQARRIKKMNPTINIRLPTNPDSSESGKMVIGALGM
jgi:hypothetical protein